MGETADIGNATVFLFSDAANYITGQVFVVDGGAVHLSTLGNSHAYPESVLNPKPRL